MSCSRSRLQKLPTVVFVLVFVFLVVQYFYTFSFDDSTKMITPTNSLFYIDTSGTPEPEVIGVSDNSTQSGTDDILEEDDRYEPLVEEDNSSRDALDSSVINTQSQASFPKESCVAKRKLVGLYKVSVTAPPFFQIAQELPELKMGGYFIPNCTFNETVAIIVPYRDRKTHLGTFLYNIHPMLQRQQIAYHVFVIEQGGTDPFNRAMLFNVGFSEALKLRNFSCFIFHDVDLLPENDHNLYQCPDPGSPRHMSVAVDVMMYRLPYKAIFGGVSALTTEQFRLVNGFSNRYWGWGAEDDDISNRIAFHGLYISRYSPIVARYKMLKHKHQRPNTNRYKILNQGKQHFSTDGLSNLNYTVEELSTSKLYTLIKVRLARV